MKDINEHFSEIADEYRNLRILDLEPILYISRQLNGMSSILGADIGCGTGRYDLLLLQNIGDKLFLHCVDNNKEMLDQLCKYLTPSEIRKFEVNCCAARNLPFEDESLDCIFSFNAVHHFNVHGFFGEASRILKNGGQLFVYTRTPTQNSRNIWGRLFPLFNEKETRLYEEYEVKETLREIPRFEMKKIVYFTHKRTSDLSWLRFQARNHHYSTFCFYSEEEFKESMEQFTENLHGDFQDLNNITWNDENILYCIKKIGKIHHILGI